MTRFVLIDSNSGYVWFDTGNVGGHPLDPRDAARWIDEENGCPNRHYFEHSPGKHVDESHYLVYEVPENFPEIGDGQDAATIGSVEANGSLKAKVTWADEDC